MQHTDFTHLSRLFVLPWELDTGNSEEGGLIILSRVFTAFTVTGVIRRKFVNLVSIHYTYADIFNRVSFVFKYIILYRSRMADKQSSARRLRKRMHCGRQTFYDKMHFLVCHRKSQELFWYTVDTDTVTDEAFLCDSPINFSSSMVSYRQLYCL